MNENQLTISQKIDGVVLSVIGNKGLQGFQKAHTVSGAIVELEKLLDDEYMKPIMALQGTTLGFKTDKDLIKENGKWVKGSGYPVEIVRRCLIEAVLKGYQPTNNEFNIIAGNMYPTKNGLERQVKEYPGLKHSIIPQIKTFDTTKGSALVDATIKWTLNNGEQNEEIVPIPLKIDAYTSVDGVMGKAKRKALAWLLSTVTGEVVVDGDVEDVKFEDLGNAKVAAAQPTKTKKTCSKKELDDCEKAIRGGEATLEQLDTVFEFTDEQYNHLQNIAFES